MPAELLESLDTEEGMVAFREVWPDIVDAFLFRRASKLAALAARRKSANRNVKRRRIPAE